MDRNDCSQTGVVFLSFLTGAMVGATAALLFAPRSGKDTREKIAEFGTEIKGKINELPEQLKTQAAPLVNYGKDIIAKGEHYVDDQKKILSAAYEAGKEAMKHEKETLAASIKGQEKG
ncbi:MAG: hypothetical protein A2521_01930 [Deltaproteobacteria bacterium RIFOXYD12_FULL_57_12]|nr:MAG: hypothetical protein A2521_01930 [Deltaproteobacteria bacterium RIFOXYD12_FULL_57_12]